ncbi:MAG TPA: dTMP kinase [Fibrobacteria bacterium]|nr:dTMP kinase [Fibrobacteria bacterium]HOX51126.1 dTMP kinase [Fibrobacteria bacterium]
MNGVLFSFEGIDGSGKTTQVGMLADSLRARGHVVDCLREPGGTPLGERVRGLLLDPSDEPPVPLAELLLFSAARAQIVQTRVLPALARGEVVILDRFHDATFAYQGFGRNLSIEAILALEGIAAGISPHRTWLLDVPLEVAASRRGGRGGGSDRMEAEAEAFRERVRTGYLERAANVPDRIRVVDASESPEAIGREILSDALQILGKAGSAS